MSKLTDFIVKLGDDLALQKAYAKDPNGVMKKNGLSAEECRALRSGDYARVVAATGAAQPALIIFIPPYELQDFLETLATNTSWQRAYAADPEGFMSDMRLSQSDIELVLRGDEQEIYEAVGKPPNVTIRRMIYWLDKSA